MARTYSLGFLIPPVLMLALAWGLLDAGYMNGVEVLAFISTPATVLVLAWAALVANEIANRRSETLTIK
jgi:ACR3 family arsenite efflux pump ArsB